MKKILSLLMLLSLGSNILSQPRFMQSQMREEQMGEEDGSALEELIDLKKTLGKIKLSWMGLMAKMHADKFRLMLDHKKESMALKLENLQDLREGESIEQAAKIWKQRLLEFAHKCFKDWQEFHHKYSMAKKQLAEMTKSELERFEPEGNQPLKRLGKAIKGKLEEVKNKMPEMPEVKPMAKQMPNETSPMTETEVK